MSSVQEIKSHEWYDEFVQRRVTIHWKMRLHQGARSIVVRDNHRHD